MATVYSGTGTCGGRSARQWRIALTYSTSTSNTAVTVSWTATIQMKSAAQYGVGLSCGGESTTGYITSSSSDWKDVCSVSGSTSYPRTTSAQTKTITASGWGETVSGYSAADGSLSVSASISVPALASYAVTYHGSADDAVNVPSGQTKYYGESLTLATATPTREGYIFLGWSTSSTATTADSAYAPGSAYTGNAALDLYAVWELAYHVPIISAVTVGRCDKDGNADDYGAYALVTFSWQTDDGFGATIASASVALEGGSSVAATVTGTNAGTGRAVVGGSLSSETSYKATISVTDSEGGTGVATGVIPAVMFPIDFLGNGKGVAFGMPASREGYADFGYKLAIDGIDVDLIQQATFYSTAANADETATAWVTTALDEVKAATDGFDEVATFKSGVVTFLKDGCYELSGSIYWSGSATSGGVGIFNGDVEESSAFFTGDMSQITAVLMPTIVNVTAGETRIFKRRCVAGAYMRYGIYSWLTIKYLGTGGSLIGGSGESAGASGAYLPLTGGVMTGSITNADGNCYKFTSDAGMRGNSSGALILNSVNDQGVYLRPNGSSGSDGVVVKAAGLLPEASGAMALGADDRRFQQVFGREYYFDNADAAYSSAYKFGMYQWQDNFTFVTRNAANTHLLDAWQIAGATGVTNFLVRPTLNGAGLATQSEIPSLTGYATQTWVEGKGYLTAMPSHSHDSVTYQDTRNANQTPDQLSKGLSVHLKANGTDGISDGGSYHPVLALKPWGDISGGPYGQLAMTQNGNMYWRVSASGTEWGSWQQVAKKSEIPSLSGYATQSWVTTQISNASLSGGSVDLSDYARLSVANTYNGEQKFQNSSYCPTVTDTASGVGCAFKASRGLANEMLVDKLIMTASTGKLPIYKYTATGSGQMTGLAEVAYFDGGALVLTPPSGEGGQIQLEAAADDSVNNGICIDTAGGNFRIFGLQSRDGTSKPGYGNVFTIEPYAKYIGGGFYLDGTAARANADGNGNNIASTYLPKSGGTMSGPLVLTGGDAASGVGNMQLDTNGQITAKGTTATLFGRNSATSLLLGHGSYSLAIRGSAARPTYNGSNMALQSEVLKPTVLYDNASGTTGTITLAETAANFSYMEIFFMTNDAEHQSVRIASPNGKVATLSQIKPRDVDAVYLKAMNVLVSGTTITQDTTNAVSAEYNFFAGGTVGFYERYHILVTKVVGYK